VLRSTVSDHRKDTAMKNNQVSGKYVPGMYAKKGVDTETRVGFYVRTWEQKRDDTARAAEAPAPLNPCIAFSRKIGVGALEIADITAGILGCRVADRYVVEAIARQANISEAAIAFFDERFPGYINRTAKYLFGEKSFIDIDYTRHLIAAVAAIAALESTLFVGRGAHLVLPRERVLAVRLICSDDYRIRRVAQLLGTDAAEARKQLSDIDKEQAAFFKKAFGKKSAPPGEFDTVVNLDHYKRPEDVADIVALAFRKKFESAGS
jgi:cytidylate kinase